MMLRKFTKKSGHLVNSKKFYEFLKIVIFFWKFTQKNLEKKSKNQLRLRKKFACWKSDPFLVKSAKKICLGALLTQKRRFSTFSAISRVTVPFHGPTLTLSKKPSGSKLVLKLCQWLYGKSQKVSCHSQDSLWSYSRLKCWWAIIAPPRA